MQDQWSSYYQGQGPPQPSTSANYDYSQAQTQPQMPQQEPPVQMQLQQHQPMSATTPPQNNHMQSDFSGYLMPQIYTGDSALSLSMRSGPSSSISSSVSSASGHPSPTSMRASMSSSTTGRTPSTSASSISRASPFFTAKDPASQESWFGSLQDSFLSSQQAPSYNSQEGSRPSLYRMDRMSISSPIPSAAEQSTWNQSSMSPQQRTPRRASVTVFQSSPSHQTPSYATQHVTFNPQASYQSPSHQQDVSYGQPMQSWSQPSNHPVFQPNYAYQIAPQALAGPSNPMDLHASYGPAADTGMGIDLSQSFYPSQYSWQQSQPPINQIPPTENYNFAGVLLDAEDLHLLGPDPLSRTASPAVQPAYRPAKPGWQPTFSFGSETTPKAVQQATMQPLPRQHGSFAEMQPGWNFASFHGFTPLATVAASQPLTERAASAPPPMEIQPIQMPASLQGEDMNRRRGSSVDSPSMLPSQFSTFPHPTMSPPRTTRASYQSSPVYLGRGPAKFGQNSIAARRATVGPSPLDLAKSTSSSSSALSQSISMDYNTVPPASAPVMSDLPTSPIRRRGNRRAMAPMFINFTTKDAKKLLSGVAPSGSSKRKREGEARNQAKHVKFDTDIKEDSAESADNAFGPA